MLGIPNDNPNRINIDDPVSDEFYNYFRETANKNTLIFEEVFSTLPSDRVRRFDQVSQYTEGPKLKDTDPYEVKQFYSIDIREFSKSFILGTKKTKRYSRFSCRISTLFP